MTSVVCTINNGFIHSAGQLRLHRAESRPRTHALALRVVQRGRTRMGINGDSHRLFSVRFLHVGITPTVARAALWGAPHRVTQWAEEYTVTVPIYDLSNVHVDVLRNATFDDILGLNTNGLVHWAKDGMTWGLVKNCSKKSSGVSRVSRGRAVFGVPRQVGRQAEEDDESKDDEQ